jgi:hypothetical protein
VQRLGHVARHDDGVGLERRHVESEFHDLRVQ